MWDDTGRVTLHEAVARSTVSARQTPASSNFGVLLRQHRLALGLSQEELADRSGLSVRAISDMERGRTVRPHRMTVQSLAEALSLREPERSQFERSARIPGGDTGSSEPAVRAGLHQLPVAVPEFIGRAVELDALTQILDGARAGGPGTVVISAIGGTAGVGKTALALHWAHQVASRFGDGQLYVNLRGFGPSGSALSTAEATAGFLESMGVPPERIPASHEAQAGLYRSILSDKQMLIVLDNARDEQQVRPLLPASAGCMVVVTSRNQLSGLAAIEAARLLSLDVLAHHEAVQLLTARLGAARAAAEPAAMSRIAGLCACLPLALAITAARAAARPALPLAVLADELLSAAGRLDALDAGDPAASVRAVFSWSYHQLTSDSARMFRLLGLHPGPDITVRAAASLAAVSSDDAGRMLDELMRANLIVQHDRGRYSFHDLLRAYAAVQVSGHDGGAERDAAVARLFDHYLQTGFGAAQLLRRTRETMTPPPPLTGVVPEQFDAFDQAMAWFQGEYRVLPMLVGQAAQAGLDSLVWQLGELLTTFFDRRGYWEGLRSAQQVMLSASVRMSDQDKQAAAYHRLGQSCNRLDYREEARAHFGRALNLYRQLGDSIGQGRVHSSLGALSDREGRSRDALDHARQAYELFRSADNRGWQATVLNNMGWCHARLGEYEQALSCTEQAIALHQELGKRESEACAWDSLGYAHAQLGQRDEALTCYRRAITMFRELGDRFNEADVLTHLGDFQLAAGEPARAREAWQLALVILNDLRHPDAREVRSRLAIAHPA
jgi:tetratricopeptide (TPR) repeat protein/transcriptional regulator with XRE-family HTH domain